MIRAVLEQPDLVPIGGRRYKLRDGPYIYPWSDLYGRRRIIVPDGYINDGASVPRTATWLTGIRRDGLLRAAALIHDILYERQGDMTAGSGTYQEYINKQWLNRSRLFTRKEADDLFFRIMSEAGYGSIRTWLAYSAVRSPFGWLAWHGVP